MIDGEKLKTRRIAANLTQEELADRIDVSVSVIRKAEYEIKDLSLGVAAKAAHVMGCKIEDFLRPVAQS